jgi:hypothetical protein
VPDRKSETLFPIIKKNIASESDIISDEFSVYVTSRRKISRLMHNDYFRDMNYNHEFVNHSKEFVNKDDKGVFTNNIERHWSYLRKHVKRNVHLNSIESYIKNFLFFYHTTPEERYHIYIKMISKHTKIFLSLL